MTAHKMRCTASTLQGLLSHSLSIFSIDVGQHRWVSTLLQNTLEISDRCPILKRSKEVNCIEALSVLTGSIHCSLDVQDLVSESFLSKKLIVPNAESLYKTRYSTEWFLSLAGQNISLNISFRGLAEFWEKSPQFSWTSLPFIYSPATADDLPGSCLTMKGISLQNVCKPILCGMRKILNADPTPGPSMWAKWLILIPAVSCHRFMRYILISLTCQVWSG